VKFDEHRVVGVRLDVLHGCAIRAPNLAFVDTFDASLSRLWRIRGRLYFELRVRGLGGAGGGEKEY
jgi:hypothetical protein